MSLPSINILDLTISEILPGQAFSCCPYAQPPTHPDTTGEITTQSLMAMG